MKEGKYGESKCKWRKIKGKNQGRSEERKKDLIREERDEKDF
jgi:hypothetical protein